SHQRFRLLTRNWLFTKLFLKLPLQLREKLVNKVRTISQTNHNKSIEQTDVVAAEVIKSMSRRKVKTLIHGHTHKPGLSVYDKNRQELKRYVLSDWDDTPQLLCYDNTKGIYFIQLDLEIINA
ncbi:MAG: UDP-2,3-diacylglucosamine diphosphatase, partial [bacterium]|nr:UDP-2,3-diacylglucosamine diphosphatase [bacterium]